MRNKITRLKNKVLALSVMALLALIPVTTNAQWCSASGYGCYMMSSTVSYPGGWITDVVVKNSQGNVLGSYGGIGCSSSTQVVVNAGAPIDITAGETLTLEITTGESKWGYGTFAGVWLDANYDKSFSAAECVANPTSGPFSYIANKGTGTGNFTVPCVTSAGASRIRVRGACQYYSLSSSNACNYANTYGNTVDIEVNIKLATPPTADFTLPSGNNWTNDIMSFNAKSPSSFYTYKWSFETPTTVVSSTGSKGQAIWNTAKSAPGYEVKMKVSYCAYADSISKFIKINAPTNAPVADFIASSNLVPIYDYIYLKDLSSNGPHTWSWEITSPNNGTYTIAGSSLNERNPVILADDIGKWNFCLTSTNNIGSSTKVCKNKYVEVTPPVEYVIGPDKEGTNKNGRLVDDGGSTANYSNNAKPSNYHFLILPCGAKKITIKFSELKFAGTGDKLRFYDGKDEAAPLIATINSANQAAYLSSGLSGVNGAMYITFESDGSGNDAGFIANWDSDLEAPKNPIADFFTIYNPIANSKWTDFVNTSKDVQGVGEFEWLVDDNNVAGPSSVKDLSYVFTTDGTYSVCLVAKTCNGVDTTCKNVNVATPTTAGTLDYVASNRRPKVGENVDITVTSDYANNFSWSIFPTSYSATQDSRGNLKIKFNAGGCYTFTLKAYNTAGGTPTTDKTVIKNKYICVVDPCTPTVDNMSTDIAMHIVRLKKGSTTLFENETSSSVATAYENFSSTVKADVTFGATYNFDIERKTNSNAVNYKVWVDFNIDGDFNDAGEEVWSSGVLTGYTASGSFTVPPLSQSFEGPTLMRIGSSYNNFPNTPCGSNIAGEFEDYGLILANDKMAPIITLHGGDTIYVERTTTAGACWAEAKYTTYEANDATQGDLTADVAINSDLDCTVPGIYTTEFTVTDASGNPAPAVRRTIIVVLDKTPPVLTLLGANPITIEQCDAYNEPGYVAIDAVDGNLSNGAVIVTGSVNGGVVGDYTLTYTVRDAQGNTTSKTRTVYVRDTKKPHIIMRGNPIVDGTVIPVQIGSTFADEVRALDECNGNIAVNAIAGFNGFVNTLDRRTYPIVYQAVDPSGNKAVEYGFTINYAVKDYIPPVVDLKTPDVVIHDVNTPYVSTPVTYSDNYYPMSKLSLVKTGTVDPYTLGTYTETYTCTDEDGNATTVVRTVKVVDRISPEILAPAVNLCIGTPFWAMQGLVMSDNYDSPSSLLSRVIIMNHNINIWEAGVYYVNYQVSDASGNKSMMVSRPVFVNYPPNCQNTYMFAAKANLKEAVSIFPNPVSDKLQIQYNVANTQAVNIEITNMSGQVVYRTTSIGGAAGVVVDMSNLSAGIYNVRLTNNGQSVTEKVSVQK